MTLERVSAESHDSPGHTHFLPHAQPTPAAPRRGPAESTPGRGTGRGGGGAGELAVAAPVGDAVTVGSGPGSARRAVGCLP